MKRFIAAICASALIISAVPVLANPSIGEPTFEGPVVTDSGEAVTINPINTETVVLDYGVGNGGVIAQVNSSSDAITPSEAASADAENNVKVVTAGDGNDIPQEELKDWSYTTTFVEASAEDISGSTLTMSVADALVLNSIDDIDAAKEDIKAGKYGAELRDQEGHKANVKVGLDDEGNLTMPIPEDIGSPFAYALIQKTAESASDAAATDSLTEAPTEEAAGEETATEG